MEARHDHEQDIERLRRFVAAILRDDPGAGERIRAAVRGGFADADVPDETIVERRFRILDELDDGSGIFTTGQIARVLGVSLQTVIRMTERGEFATFKVPGSRHRRITRSSVGRWIRGDAATHGETPGARSTRYQAVN